MTSQQDAFKAHRRKAFLKQGSDRNRLRIGAVMFLVANAVFWAGLIRWLG